MTNEAQHDMDKIPGIGSIQDLIQECNCFLCKQLQGTKVTYGQWLNLHQEGK